MHPSTLHRFPLYPRAFRLLLATLLGAGSLAGLPADSGEGSGVPPAAGGSPGGPAPLTEADFATLKANSPFLRPLNLSESLILTGIARIQGDLFATLIDRKTKETHVVSQAANSQGWRLVGVDGNQDDLETVTAQISAFGGEIFSVRFDEHQLKPGEGKPAVGPGGSAGQRTGSSSRTADYREGISGDGFRGPPPPELVAKLSRLSQEQRDRVIKQIGEIRDKNQISSEDRQVLFIRMVDRALKEKR